MMCNVFAYVSNILICSIKKRIFAAKKKKKDKDYDNDFTKQIIA
jgi:hypothetical protein